MKIKELKPSLLWSYFYDLTQIPRPSHHEEAVQNYVLEEAKRLNLWAERDTTGNILVRKPASKGLENQKGVILQSHLDMVAQKNNDKTHDFLKDPIEAYIDGDWVTANGTTLGADNGIGAATALAILADSSLIHGPIEALFTATEETGMDGAKNVQANWIQGDYLINLDSEELGEICIGCAGGVDANFTLPLNLITTPDHLQTYQINISGLKGGHSGMDIIKQRGNAIKILARLLSSLNDIHVHMINGGSLRNAIPREAEASFSTKLTIDEIKDILNPLIANIQNGLPQEDKSVTYELSKINSIETSWDKSSQTKALAFLRLCNDGVDRMSMDTIGVVETSDNLSKVETTQNTLIIQCLLRSLIDDARDDLANRMAILCQSLGGNAQFTGQYPGWQPAPQSDLIKIVSEIGEKMLPNPPMIRVIHAGLECGILSENYPNWQMLSIGPTIEMPHSPDERVEIESVEKYWNWLLEILKNIK